MPPSSNGKHNGRSGSGRGIGKAHVLFEAPRPTIRFPKLSATEWPALRASVHAVARLIGEVRGHVLPPAPDWSHGSLEVTLRGFGFPPIAEADGLCLECDLLARELTIQRNGRFENVPLAGWNIADLRAHLLSALPEYGLVLAPEPNEPTAPLALAAAQCEEFVAQLTSFDALLREFHESISTGRSTPIHLWPHHLDNSFIWYSGRMIGDVEEQIGVGISSGDDYHQLPYIYLTPWPVPETFETIAVADGGCHHTRDWKGFDLLYGAIMEIPDVASQRKLIAAFLTATLASFRAAFDQRAR
jgi:hypothetical protein